MAISRRKFMKAGTMVLLTAGIPMKLADTAFGQKIRTGGPDSASGFQVPYASQIDPTFYLTSSMFTPYLNTTFRFRPQAGRPVTLKLFKVTDLKRASNRNSAGDESFSLVFRGARNNVLSQDVYSVEHDALGKYNLLTVPVGLRDKRELSYEIIINRRSA